MPKAKKVKPTSQRDDKNIYVYTPDAKMMVLEKAFFGGHDNTIDSNAVEKAKALNLIYQLKKGVNTSKAYKKTIKVDESQKDDGSADEFVEPPWDFDLLLDLVRFNTWHYICIDIKCEDAIRHGFKYLYKGETSSDDNKNKIALQDFFKKTNSDGMNFFDVCIAMLKDSERGNGTMAMEVVRTLGSVLYTNNTSEIIEVKHVDATRIRPHRYAFVSSIDKHYKPVFKFLMEDGNDKYFKKFGAEGIYHKYNGRPVDEENPAKSLDDIATELIYKVNYEPGSGEGYNHPYYPYYGLSPLIPMFIATLGNRNAGMFNLSFFKNTIKNMIMVKGKLDNKSLEKLRNYMEVLGTNPEMLPDLYMHTDYEDGGIDIKQLVDRALEASFLQYCSQNKEEIIAGHKMPAHRVYSPESGKLSGNIAEVANDIYKDTTLAPLQRMIDEGLVNPYIIESPFGFNIQDWNVSFNRMGTIDHKYKLDETCRLLDRGVITLGDAANRLGIDTIFKNGEGDMRIILSTYLKLDLLLSQTSADRIPSNSSSILDPNKIEKEVKK